MPTGEPDCQVAAAARVFAREGALLVIGARSGDKLAALWGEIHSTGGTASCVAGDVSSADSAGELVATALEQHQRLDGAFNNAGISQGGGLLADVTEDRFDELVSVNLKGVWLSMRAQIKAMLATGTAGAIVNTSSVGGVSGGRSLSVYMATKDGVIGLRHGAAHDNGDRGIRVNAIAPGTTYADERDFVTSAWTHWTHQIRFASRTRHILTGAALGSEKFIRMPVHENPRCGHNHSVSEPDMTRQPDRSRRGWLSRPPANWWLRFAIPSLTIFGGGFLLRILFRRTDDSIVYLYGTVAALGMVALVVGLIKVKRSAG